MKGEIPAIGIIGGSGLYQMEELRDPTEHKIETPFGPPSDSLIGGQLKGRQVYFLPRHARGHRLLPHELNHRANIYALRSLNVRWIVSVTAVGSLQEKYAPRDVLLPSQFYDRTSARSEHTFFGEGIAAHISFAEPISTKLRNLIADSARSLGDRARDHGDDHGLRLLESRGGAGFSADRDRPPGDKCRDGEEGNCRSYLSRPGRAEVAGAFRSRFGPGHGTQTLACGNGEKIKADASAIFVIGEKMLALHDGVIVIIDPLVREQFCPYGARRMNIKIATALLGLALLPACSSTQTTAQHQTLEQRLMAKYASNDNAAEPAPPAEGPEDIPAGAPSDVNGNPSLVPTPLLRASAASSTP